MARWLTWSALALAITIPARAAEITGKYVEVRTCDIYTAPCFANAEINLGGKHALLAWKVEQGALDNVRLDGLSVVAIVASTDTLGEQQSGPSRAVLLVDKKATVEQREALIKLAKRQAGPLVAEVIDVQPQAIDLSVADCKEGGCAFLDAGIARLQTRCVDRTHDKACGNEGVFYPPLARDVQATAAVATEHSYRGSGLGTTWTEYGRRGGYVGTFQTR